MKRYDANAGIPTLDVAISEYMNADDLRKLGALTKEKLPTRKADLAQVVVRHLEGERLRAVWQGLDEIQRAAVAEVVHSRPMRFPADRFRAKYGSNPNWGSADKYGGNRSPSPLCFFFYGNGVMPADLKERLKAFVPAPADAKVETLEHLPPIYDRPFERWNSKTKEREEETEPIPLTVRETERSAARELLSVLRLVDGGNVAVSDKTRRASSATIDAITAVLEGGDYHPFNSFHALGESRRLGNALADHGLGVLRFDFTGLGESEGDFADTDFASNVEDLVAAAAFLRRKFAAPRLLVGHSLGGTAILAAAARIPESVALATIGAPSDTGHLGERLLRLAPELEERGEAEVLLEGRPFRIRRQLIDDLREKSVSAAIRGLGRALLVMHSPVDETVDIDSNWPVEREVLGVRDLPVM